MIRLSDQYSPDQVYGFSIENTENKEARIRTTLNYYLAKGLFRFRRGSPGAIELVNELRSFPSNKRKVDGPDALTMAVRELLRLWNMGREEPGDLDDTLLAY